MEINPGDSTHAVPKNMNKNTKISVLMIGPSIESKGGISQVIGEYKNAGFFKKFNITFIPTYSDKNNVFKILYLLKGICQFIIKLPFNKIVHIHNSYGWSFRRKTIFLILSNLFKKSTILHFHGSKFDVWYDSISYIEKVLVKWLLLKANLIITLSQNWKSKIIEISPLANVVILVNAINTSKFKLKKVKNDPSSPYKILFLGRIGKRKGIYDILDAINILPKSKYKFTLAGDGETETIKKIVEKMQRSSEVEIPGWVGNIEKNRLLEDSDLLILPSYNEGLPISILEAMAFSLPIISSGVGGIPLAVKNGINGLIVPTGKPNSIAESLENIFSDLSKWKKFSFQSRKILENDFAFTKLQVKLEKIYHSLI